MGGVVHVDFTRGIAPPPEPTVDRRTLMEHFKLKSPTTVNNWIKLGCPYKKAPGRSSRLRFCLREVEKWLESR